MANKTTKQSFISQNGFSTGYPQFRGDCVREILGVVLYSKIAQKNGLPNTEAFICTCYKSSSYLINGPFDKATDTQYKLNEHLVSQLSFLLRKDCKL